MILGQVRGRVVSTAKIESLSGKKLLVVEVVSVRDHGLVRTGREMVCVDAVQAGEGELVVVVQGSSSRIAPDMREVPTDAVIVGSIDELQSMGEKMELSD